MTIREQATRKIGRPRSAQSHQAILRATLELLAEMGYQGMSIEAVAAHAGVGKTTIYRRWPSKDALVLAAIQSVQSTVPVIDTGNFRDDMISLVYGGLETLSENPFLEKLLFSVLGEIKSRPAIFQAFQQQLLAPRFGNLAQIVKHAQERGEVRSDLDPYVVISLFAAPVFYQFLMAGIASPAGSWEYLATTIVDSVLDGIRPRSTT